jgi:glutamate-1-semialdehyde aminotransferase
VARLLDEHPGQVAGMIIEPIMMNAGIIPPEPGYLAALEGQGAVLSLLLLLVLLIPMIYYVIATNRSSRVAS